MGRERTYNKPPPVFMLNELERPKPAILCERCYLSSDCSFGMYTFVVRLQIVLVGVGSRQPRDIVRRAAQAKRVPLG